MANRGFAGAMKEYFGYLPGQGAAEFMKELKALSYPEKQEFHEMLVSQAGIPCDPPTAPAK